MKFLADENIEYPVITFLQKMDVDIIAVRDILRGATDSVIVEYAFSNNLIIVTSDKDFGELTFRLKKRNCGVILIRYTESNCEQKASLLLKVIDKLGSSVVNNFIVIDKYKVRIKKMI